MLLFADVSELSLLLTILTTAVLAFLGGYLTWKTKWWAAKTKAEGESRKVRSEAAERDSEIAYRGRNAEIDLMDKATSKIVEKYGDDVRAMRKELDAAQIKSEEHVEELTQQMVVLEKANTALQIELAIEKERSLAKDARIKSLEGRAP